MPDGEFWVRQALLIFLTASAAAAAGIYCRRIKKSLKSLELKVRAQESLISNMTKMYNDTVEYDRNKTEFFSNITHELKTPLSVILGAIQLMDQKSCVPGGEEQRAPRQLKIIRQNCYRLLKLINNILDISRIESGYIKLNPVYINIVSLIEEITQSVVPYAEQKGIRLLFDTDIEVIMTAVDVDKIERIVLNLLSNAIKFTSPGGQAGVAVNLNNDRITISVKDEGPGIPENKRTEIFERFKQVGDKATVQSEGSGIGLSIVKTFVELLGGDIRLLSEENRGSEFIVTLPVRPPPPEELQAHAAFQPKGRVIESINIELSDIYSTCNADRKDTSGGEKEKTAM